MSFYESYDKDLSGWSGRVEKQLRGEIMNKMTMKSAVESIRGIIASTRGHHLSLRRKRTLGDLFSPRGVQTGG